MHDLTGIRAFVAVAEANSFTHAAKRLALSSSVVSHHVARLEQQLGITLLNRSTRHVGLTDDGARYLERARPLLEEAHSLFQETRQRGSEVSGQLKITVPPGIAEHRLLEPTLDFMQAHPAVNVVLDVNPLHVDVIAEGYDAAIRSGALVGAGLRSRRLTTINFKLCAAPAYLARHGAPASVADLADHAVAHWLVPGGQAPWRFETGRGRAEVAVTGPLVTNSLQGQYAAVMAGLAIAALPTFLVREQLASGELVALLDDAAIPPSPVWIVWPDRPFETARLRCFIDHLAAALSPGGEA